MECGKCKIVAEKMCSFLGLSRTCIRSNLKKIITNWLVLPSSDLWLPVSCKTSQKKPLSVGTKTTQMLSQLFTNISPPYSIIVFTSLEQIIMVLIFYWHLCYGNNGFIWVNLLNLFSTFFTKIVSPKANTVFPWIAFWRFLGH